MKEIGQAYPGRTESVILFEEVPIGDTLRKWPVILRHHPCFHRFSLMQ